MKTWWKSVIENKRNFTCVYIERTNTVYSVPKTKSNVGHIFYTIVTILIFLGAAGALRILAKTGLEQIVGNEYPWWATALDSLVGAIALIFFFVILGGRLGILPGINGFKLVLDKNSATDQKLIKLLKKNPRVFNIDWMRRWAEAKNTEREKMLESMREAVQPYLKKKQKQKKAKASQA